jgi:hypothetical protein
VRERDSFLNEVYRRCDFFRDQTPIAALNYKRLMPLHSSVLSIDPDNKRLRTETSGQRVNLYSVEIRKGPPEKRFTA